MATWHNLESARDEWADAPLDDEQLSNLLEAAKEAVLAYAPSTTVEYAWQDGYYLPVGEPAEISRGWRIAQLMQSRNIWNSSKATPGTGDFDGSNYGISTFPLDWQVKQLIRPRSVFGGTVA